MRGAGCSPQWLMTSAVLSKELACAAALRFFDSDTHLNPMAETLEPYFDPAMRQRMPATRLFHALTPL